MLVLVLGSLDAELDEDWLFGTAACSLLTAVPADWELLVVAGAAEEDGALVAIGGAVTCEAGVCWVLSGDNLAGALLRGVVCLLVDKEWDETVCCGCIRTKAKQNNNTRARGGPSKKRWELLP